MPFLEKCFYKYLHLGKKKKKTFKTSRLPTCLFIYFAERSERNCLQASYKKLDMIS